MPSLKAIMGVTLVLAGLLIPNRAPAPHGFGNGGDPLALAFVSKGYDLNHFIAQGGGEGLSEPVDLERFSLALLDARIEMVDHPLTDMFGASVTAKYYSDDPMNPGKPLIQVRRDYWKELLESDSLGESYRFVFHEYLWVMEKNDANFRISATLDYLKLLRQVEEDETAYRLSVESRPEARREFQLHMPRRELPQLACSDLMLGIDSALHSADYVKEHMVLCSADNNFVHFTISFKTKADYRPTFDVASGYATLEDCYGDEEAQTSIYLDHFRSAPAAIECTPYADHGTFAMVVVRFTRGRF